jgi:hypothetical protein
MSTGSMCDGARELLRRQCTANTEVRTRMGESSQTLKLCHVVFYLIERSTVYTSKNNVILPVKYCPFLVVNNPFMADHSSVPPEQFQVKHLVYHKAPLPLSVSISTTAQQ